MRVLKHGTATLLISHDGLLWTAERSEQKKDYARFLECPGGELLSHMEAPINGAVREVKEETALDIEVSRFEYRGVVLARGWSISLYMVDLKMGERPDDTEKDKRSAWIQSTAEVLQNRWMTPALGALVSIYLHEGDV